MPLDTAAANLAAQKSTRVVDDDVMDPRETSFVPEQEQVQEPLDVDILEWLLKVGYGRVAESLHKRGLNTISRLISEAKSNPAFCDTMVELKPVTRKKFLDMLRNTSHPNYPQSRKMMDFSQHVWYQVSTDGDDEHNLVDPKAAEANAASAAMKGEVFIEMFTARNIALNVEKTSRSSQLPVIAASPEGRPYILPGYCLVSVNGIDLAGHENTYAKALEILASSPRPVALGFRAPYELASLLAEFGEEAYFDAVRLQIRRKLPFQSKNRFSYKAVLKIGEAGLVAAGLSESTAFQVWYRAKEILAGRRLGRTSTESEVVDESSHHSLVSVTSMDSGRDEWGVVDTEAVTKALETAAEKGEVYTEVFTAQSIILPVEPSENPGRLPVLMASPEDKPHIPPGYRIVMVDGVELLGSDDTFAKALDILANSERPIILGFLAPNELLDLLADFDEESRFDAIRLQIRKRLPWSRNKRGRFSHKTVVNLGEAGLVAAGLSVNMASQIRGRAKELTKDKRRSLGSRSSSSRLSDESISTEGTVGTLETGESADEELGAGAQKVAAATKTGDVYFEEFTEQKLYIPMKADNPRHLPELLASPEGKPYIAPGHRLVSVGGVKLTGAEDTRLKALMLMAAAPRPLTLGFWAPNEMWNLLEEFSEQAHFDEVRVQMKKKLPWAPGNRFTMKTVLALGEQGLLEAGISQETASLMVVRAKTYTSATDGKRMSAARSSSDSHSSDSLASPVRKSYRLTKSLSYPESTTTFDESLKNAGAAFQKLSRGMFRTRSGGGMGVSDMGTVSLDESIEDSEIGQENAPADNAPLGVPLKNRAEPAAILPGSEVVEKPSSADISISL